MGHSSFLEIVERAQAKRLHNMSSSLEQAYRELKEGLGFSVLNARTTIELTGADRAQFLHNFCTNDVLGLKPGDGCEAFITNVQGKIVAYVLIFCEADSIILESDADQAESILTHLGRYLIREDVVLTDRSEETRQIYLGSGTWHQTLASPGAVEICHQPMSHTRYDLGHRTVCLRNITGTSLPVFQISCLAEIQNQVVGSLQELGARACSADAVEIIRVEAGVPIYGADITDENLPQELGRENSTISFTKGCYLGQETVARIDALGHVNWLFKGIRFLNDVSAQPGTELMVDGTRVGRVTSSIYSPFLNSAFSLGYVRGKHAAAGTRITTSAGPLEVLNLPLVDR